LQAQQPFAQNFCFIDHGARPKDRLNGVPGMPTRAEYFRAEAEKCRKQAKKAASATAMSVLLDMAEDFKRKAAQAEMEDKDAKPE
jgi:hypothetical protein